jgi:hypothetical protein
MNVFDRRRFAVACVLTLVALPALWLASRNSASSVSPSSGGSGVSTTVAATAPPTTAYQPQPPLFVGGDAEPQLPPVINVAVPPAPGPNEQLALASYHRYLGVVGTTCSAPMAPDGVTLTITNVNNGLQVTCTNSPASVVVPGGADLVIDTALFVRFADLNDAPITVRVSWQ